MDKVVFRKFNQGDVIALFPDMPTHKGYITSYQHVGQHSDASPELIHDLEPANESEALELAEELISIGYEIELNN